MRKQTRLRAEGIVGKLSCENETNVSDLLPLIISGQYATNPD